MNPANDPPAAHAVTGAVSQAVEKKSQYYTLLYQEMRERQRAEQHLRRSNALLNALSAAQLRFVAGDNLEDVFQGLLASLLAMTNSRCGLIAEFLAGDEASGAHRPVYTVLAQAGGALADAECWPDFADVAAQTLAAPAPFCTVGRQGQAPCCRLALPFVVGGAAIGVLALVTEVEGDELAAFLQPALATCGQLIQAKRNELRRKEAEHALAQERASLAQRVEDRTAELQTVNAELGRAMRAKDEFLATINHELRSPLSAVLLSAETLSYQLDGSLSKRQLRTVQNIQESAHHLLDLINEMLDVAKMEAGKLRIEIKPCQVKDACQASLRLVAEAAEKNQITLSCSIDNAWEIDADERRLTQILVNLLSNAVKFTPTGGEIGLEVCGDSETDTIHFTVWDTGIGIGAEDMSKLFRPFSQVDNSRTRQQAGTGLGLALVYRMAELHGGGVTVTSTPDVGSRFTVSLPRQHHRVQLLPQRAAPPPGQSLPVILVADDNQASLEALAGYLELYPCRIVLARNGREAVEAARTHRPHLVLMDVQMPEVDGLQAMRLIHAETELAAVPVVAMTALVTPADRDRCLAAGAREFLSKPIHPGQLQQVLEDNLNCRPLPLLVRQAQPVTGQDLENELESAQAR